MLHLKANEHNVYIQNEPTFVHADLETAYLTQYQRRYVLDSVQLATTAHGVKYGEPDVLYSCMLVASGGTTGVHSRSALLHGTRCIVAISSFLVCLQLPNLDVLWQAEVDTASCFGVYHLSHYASYLSQGELDIARVSYNGEILWSSSGKDIFTNGFTLCDDYVEVLDFNNEKYHIDLLTGHSVLVQV